MAEGETITIAYDGECMFCSRSIRFLAEHDRHKRLSFVPLQTPLGREIEEQAGSAKLSSVVIRDGTGAYNRSEGALRIMRALGGVWALLAEVGRLIPRGLRDWAYDYIAAHRYRWFGKADVCSLPSPALRERLLDGERV
ncbi:DCC1-like thiol-disulfide oxidoreductase family protein [Haloferula sp. BvORR071]|uniref:thiol-disulfide oxidoreductase DCC family protein n=1 Tax=Haloferula sp. BvORR071 TaxID=1396141 RepID=UPI0005569BF4|nr:DCC1-like thiol-disulfide oxidoreductase family protein [Haloferula sp. BvORR071]